MLLSLKNMAPLCHCQGQDLIAITGHHCHRQPSSSSREAMPWSSAEQRPWSSLSTQLCRTFKHRWLR